jgi:hypothetical protein
VLTAPLPPVELIRTSGQVELRWPISHTGWALHSSSTLAPGSWQIVTQSDNPSANHHRIVVPMSNSQTRMFYSLWKD